MAAWRVGSDGLPSVTMSSPAFGSVLPAAHAVSDSSIQSSPVAVTSRQ